MSYRIELTPAAEKALIKLAKGNRALVKKIDKAIMGLAENPAPLNSKQLSGEEPPLYRVRVGNYRITTLKMICWLFWLFMLDIARMFTAF